MIDFVDYLIAHVKTNIGDPEVVELIERQSLKSSTKQQFLLITQLPGSDDKYTTKQKIFSVQTLVQHDTDESARQLAYKVYDFLKEDYDFELAVPVGKTGNPVFITQMRPEQTPSPLGNVGNGKYRYSTTFQILLGEI